MEYARGAFSVRNMIESDFVRYEQRLRLQRLRSLAQVEVSAAVRFGVAT